MVNLHILVMLNSFQHLANVGFLFVTWDRFRNKFGMTWRAVLLTGLPRRHSSARNDRHFASSTLTFLVVQSSGTKTSFVKFPLGSLCGCRSAASAGSPPFALNANARACSRKRAGIAGLITVRLNLPTSRGCASGTACRALDCE